MEHFVFRHRCDQLLVNVPDLTRRIFAEVGSLFEQGKLALLPRTDRSITMKPHPRFG